MRIGYKIFTFIMVLVFSFFLHTTYEEKQNQVEAALNPDVSINYVNLAFEDNVYIVYLVKVLDSSTDPYMYVWSVGDGEYLTTDSDAVRLEVFDRNVNIGGKDNYFAFVYDKLSAKQMTDFVYAKAFSGSSSSNLLKYSIYEYASRILSQTQDEKLISVLSNMLEYGASCQQYFEVDGHPYNQYRLANETLYKVTVAGGTFKDGCITTYASNREELEVIPDSNLSANYAVLVDGLVKSTKFKVTKDSDVEIIENTPCKINFMLNVDSFGTIVCDNTTVDINDYYVLPGTEVYFDIDKINFTYNNSTDTFRLIVNPSCYDDHITIINDRVQTITADTSFEFVVWHGNKFINAVAVKNSNDKYDLTYYYDYGEHRINGEMFYVDSYFNETQDNIMNIMSTHLNGVAENVETVTFDSSMSSKAVNCIESLFEGFSSLKKIYNLYNLNTQNVRSTKKLFKNCEKLEYIEFKDHDNTANNHFTLDAVQVFSYMFSGCKALDVGCYVDDIKPSSSSASIFEHMFEDTGSVIVDLSSWNVSSDFSVDFSYMFTNNSDLQIVDLSGLHFASTSTIDGLLRNNYNLRIVFVGSDFVIPDRQDGVINYSPKLCGYKEDGIIKSFPEGALVNINFADYVTDVKLKKNISFVQVDEDGEPLDNSIIHLENENGIVIDSLPICPFIKFDPIENRLYSGTKSNDHWYASLYPTIPEGKKIVWMIDNTPLSEDVSLSEVSKISYKLVPVE